MSTMYNGMLSIGVDVGATKIHCGVVDALGNLIDERIMKSWTHPDRDANIDQMLRLIEELLRAHGRERVERSAWGSPAAWTTKRGSWSIPPIYAGMSCPSPSSC